VHRFRFFGREVISFLLILPLACRDHHRHALSSYFTYWGINLSSGRS